MSSPSLAPFSFCVWIAVGTTEPSKSAAVVAMVMAGPEESAAGDVAAAAARLRTKFDCITDEIDEYLVELTSISFYE